MSLSSQYLTLDWHFCPSTTEIITRLEKLLGTINAHNQAGVVNSRAKASVLAKYEDIQIMLRPANAFKIHKFGELQFWARMFRIAVTLANLLGNSSETMEQVLQQFRIVVVEYSCSISFLLSSLLLRT